MARIITLTETTDPTAVADQAIVYSKDVTGVTQLFVRLSDGAIVQLSGVSTASPIVVWTAAKTWTQVYTEITSFSSKCVVLIEPSGATRNITTGTYDINGVRFIGMPQLDTASIAYGAVKVTVDTGVTFTQDGTTLFAVISSQDVFWYFGFNSNPVTTNKIRIRLDGGKMHADANAVFTGIAEARVFLTAGAHIRGYTFGTDALIQLATSAQCVIESYGGVVDRDVINTSGTAFSAIVTLTADPASVVNITGGGGWFRSANTTPTYRRFFDGNISLDANALAMVSPNGTFYRPYIDNSGNWSNGAGMAIGNAITSATAGSVLFAGAAGVLQQDNANFFWDDTNNRLGIGTATPAERLEVVGTTQLVGAVNVIAANLTTTGGGSVYSSGDVRTNTLQHYSLPGGAGPINIMVPIAVRGGSGGLPGVSCWGGTFNTEGQIYLDPRDSPNTPSIGFQYATNATATGYINDKGYQQGTTQFRDLKIRDGKGADIATFTGSTKQVDLGGSLGVLGGVTITANSGELFKYNNSGDGSIYFAGSATINSWHGLNGTAALIINDTGYLAGITQFRDFYIHNGKGAAIATFAGSTKRTDLAGALGQKAHASFAGSDRVTTTAAVQTLNPTQTEIFTLTLTDTTATLIEARVIARDTAGVERALYGKIALVYRQGAVASIQGSVQNLHADIETSAGLDATITVSGNDVRVSVFGLSATTINWVASISYQTVSGSA